MLRKGAVYNNLRKYHTEKQLNIELTPAKGHVGGKCEWQQLTDEWRRRGGKSCSDGHSRYGSSSSSSSRAVMSLDYITTICFLFIQRLQFIQSMSVTWLLLPGANIDGTRHGFDNHSDMNATLRSAVDTFFATGSEATPKIGWRNENEY